MTTVDVLPDAERIARQWLAGHALMSALVDGRVSTDSPANPTYPYLTVARIGGIPAVRFRLDTARVQVAGWGANRSSASRVARTARSVLHELEGEVVAYAEDGEAVRAVVTAVTDDLGLGWQPDTIRTPPTPRFIFGVAIYAHAA